MCKICVDVTNITPGKGGAGGGITTYAKRLLLELDLLLKNPVYSHLEVVAVGNSGFLKSLNLGQVQTIYKDVNNQSFFGRNFWLQISLPLFLRKNKIQVLHRIIPELPLISTAKYVMTLHDFMFDFYLENPGLKKYLSLFEWMKFLFLRSMMRMGVANSSYIIVISDAIAQELKERFPEKNLNVKVAKLGANKELKSRNAVKAVDSEISLGYVAGFYPHKGHIKALRLMKDLQRSDRGKNVKLFFRGSKVYKNYYEEVESLIEKQGLKGKVFMEGYDPKLTIDEIYQKYTATLMLSEYEGFGLPVLESQSFSKPVICSDIQVFKENLNTSAIYLKDNPTQEEIEELLDRLYDKQFLDQLVEKGNENTAQYSWAKTCKEIMDVYLKLL